MPLVVRHRCRQAEAVAAVERREIEARRSPRPSRTPHSSRPHLPAGIAAIRADDQIVEAVAVDVPRPGNRTAAVVARVDAVEAEAVGAVERREIEGARRSPQRCRTPHSSRPHTPSTPSAPRAPMIRSSKPSPLTSPAHATETAAARRTASMPSRRKPFAPLSAARSRLGGEARGGAEHHIALAARSCRRVMPHGPDDQSSSRRR